MLNIHIYTEIFTVILSHVTCNKMARIAYLAGIYVLFFILPFCFSNSEDERFRCKYGEHPYEFSGTSGDIYSPMYEKGQYPKNLYCEYRITAPEGYRLKLTFKDLDIRALDFCSGAALWIFAKEREYDIGKVCGTDIPPPLITEPGINVVRLLFTTPPIGRGRGFHLHYEAAPSFEYCEKGFSECHNSKCFDPRTQKCNGVDDCGDGTDEEGCNLPLPTTECGKPPIEPDTMYRGADRITGGQEAIPGSWPWQISMQNRDTPYNAHTCGGSLINAQWVLTAGHCIQGNAIATGWRIHLGKHHKYFTDKLEQIRYVERIIVWPDKTADTNESLTGNLDMSHDIALLKLNAPVKFTDAVQPVCLPYLGWEIPVGSKCYVTGWGETRGTGSNHALKQTHVTVMPSKNCAYSEKSQICVQNEENLSSTCHGDSGGPLACKLGHNWYLMGATSFGTLSNFQSGLCSVPGWKSVFMKVSDHAEWVTTMIKAYS